MNFHGKENCQYYYIDALNLKVPPETVVDRDKIPKDLDSAECPSSHLGCFNFE